MGGRVRGLLVPTLLSLVSAGLLLLCFPPYERAWLAWVGLAPLLVALGQVRRPGQGAWCGLVFGVVFFTGINRYLMTYGFLPAVLVGLLEAAPAVLFGAVAVYLCRERGSWERALGLAGAWTLAEALRANLWGLSLTFGQLGYTQHANLPLLQTASVAGVLGISFLLALVNASLAGLLTPAGGCGRRVRRAFSVLVSVAVVVGVGLAGQHELAQPPAAGPSLSVGVAQPNVPLHTPVTAEDTLLCRNDYPQATDELMQACGGVGSGDPRLPQLVVWPETAFPVALNCAPDFDLAARATAMRDQVWLLMGALNQTEASQVFNNAWLFDDQGQLRGTYSKMDLVMFGEYVPYRDKLPFLKKYPLRDFDFSRGTDRNLLTFGNYHLGSLICFEAIFPEPARELTRRGAEFLVFLTSDAWAEHSMEVLLHSDTAPLRAVENGRWVVRAAATGRSAIISPHGELVATVEPWQAGNIQALITPRRDLTFYTQHGDAPLLVLCALLMLPPWLAGRRRWRRRRREIVLGPEDWK
ncbi:MAG TPA: apolipoprotein N-acyltransferase [Armatimonadota bacterium]|jgi:apolipoprotein N-acyltransferase